MSSLSIESQPRKTLSLKRKSPEVKSNPTTKPIETLQKTVEPQSTPKQPELSKEEREQIKRKRIKEILQIFSEHFPAVFNPADKKPLAKRTHRAIKQVLDAKDIIIPIAWIGKAIAYWTYNRAYLKAVIEGEYRYFLDGSLAEPITDEERVFSQKLIRPTRGVKPAIPAKPEKSIE